MSEIRAGDWRSPHPSEAEVERGQAQRNEPPRELPGIDLNVAEQLRLAWSLPDFEPGPRYHPDADYFARCDAYALHGILNALRPRSVVEVLGLLLSGDARRRRARSLHRSGAGAAAVADAAR
jgi:hypothetical protein